MKVVHFQRKPVSYTYSVESMFAPIRDALVEHHDIDCEVAVLPMTNRGVHRWAVNALAAGRQQSDVNHITGDVHYLAWRLDPAKTVVTVHDCGYEIRLVGPRRWAAGWATFRGPLRRVSAITVPSSFTRARVVALAGSYAKDIDVVPHCISPLYTPRPPVDVDGRPEVLHVGTTENKNLDRLVAALASVDCRLHVIGVLTSHQRDLLVRSGLEWRNSAGLTESEMVDAYAAATAIAFVSTYEGFGMPIIEAHAVERPVVTSTVASMPETAGDAALLVDPTDVGAIRTAITRVLTDDACRDELVAAGRDNLKRYSPAASADAFAAIYDRVAGR